MISIKLTEALSFGKIIGVCRCFLFIFAETKQILDIM